MKINIGITGTGSLVGQAIIKCIIKSEYNKSYSLIGFDYFKNTVGSFWCNENFILPDILKSGQEEEWVSTLITKIIENDIKVLFVGVDFELPLLAKHKYKIEEKTNCKVVVSDLEAILIGNDKYLTYEFLKNNGLNHPQTFLPQTLDYSNLIYPVIVKPRVGARSIGVHRVKNAQELEQAISKVNQPIIQELVGNNETEFTCGVISFKGVQKQSIALRRSLKDGNTHISEFKKDFPESIYEYIKKIAEALKPFGACNFQLRLDDQNTPKLFEINPRHSGTTYMRSLFGYNEVLYILAYLLEGTELSFQLKEGKAIRYFEESLIS